MTDQSPGIHILRVSNLGASHASLSTALTAAATAGFDALLITDDGLDGLDPIAAASALASLAASTGVGVIPQVDTSRQHPFGLARRLVGLDQVTYGRAGWAPVDSNAARLAEAVEIVTKLWDSWPDGVVVADKAATVWVETERIHPVVVNGEHYSVRAPLDVHRGPQGHLLLVIPRTSGDLSRFSPPVYLEDSTVVDYDPTQPLAPVAASPASPIGGTSTSTLRDRAGLERVPA